MHFFCTFLHPRQYHPHPTNPKTNPKTTPNPSPLAIGRVGIVGCNPCGAPSLRSPHRRAVCSIFPRFRPPAPGGRPPPPLFRRRGPCLSPPLARSTRASLPPAGGRLLYPFCDPAPPFSAQFRRSPSRKPFGCCVAPFPLLLCGSFILVSPMGRTIYKKSAARTIAVRQLLDGDAFGIR